jgi:hypothetical protein
LTSEPTNENHELPQQTQEHFSAISLAFGAVLGTVISVSMKPLTDLLPGRLFEEFLHGGVEMALMVGFPILLGLVAARIRRLDRLLRRYLLSASLCASLLLGLSLWRYAGWSVAKWSVISILLTWLVIWLFLLVCGGAVIQGLSVIIGKQAKAYKKRREAEAQEIAARAIADGDPGAAAGAFGAAAAGGVGEGILRVVAIGLLLLFITAAVFAVSALDAYRLFSLSRSWSLLTGAIIAAAAIQVVRLSEGFGEKFSESVPLEEKSKEILPNRNDSSDQT